ncbi:hypothetical protein BV898_02352 [Hypsibius exemplaris]|uniref:RRM domain-containing protein n=1 Tax=Hypsibius exemplaris TaxID=2072580 RepID=A0A1W0X7V2_HYPEX|nr:hypothetical protein BV898_02352 [Hypsibius exemplaris]
MATPNEASTIPVQASKAGAASADSAPKPVSARLQKRMAWWHADHEKRLGISQSQLAANPLTNLPPGETGPTPVKKPGNPKYPPRETANPAATYDPAEVKLRRQKKKEAQTFTIFVGQIPFDANEDDVRKMFEAAGKIKVFRWRINEKTKKFKGMAFVEYENKNAFRRAFQLHHALVNGRKINVEATIIGGRKSRIRAEHIKEWSARMQKEGAEMLANKVAKGVAIPPREIKSTTEGSDDGTEPTSNASKKRTKDETVDGEETAGKIEEVNGAKATCKRPKQDGGKRQPNLPARPREDHRFTHPFPKPHLQRGGFSPGARGRGAGVGRGRGLGGPPRPLVEEKSTTEAVTQENTVSSTSATTTTKTTETAKPRFDKAKSFKPYERPVVVSGVKPKESHLAAAVDIPRLHIKFPE